MASTMGAHYNGQFQMHSNSMMGSFRIQFLTMYGTMVNE